MLNEAQKSQVIARVNEMVDIANKAYGTKMAYPVVLFTVRGTCGGKAYDDYKVDFNAGLLVDNWDRYMNDTIPHEVAHCVDKHIHGTQYKVSRTGRRQRISHGPTWKNIMRTMGFDPTRTHNMDVSKVSNPKQKYLYTCSCCGAELAVGPNHHRKLQMGQPLTHKGCPRDSKLVLKEALGKVTWQEAHAAKGKAPAKKPAAKKPAAKKSKAPAAGTQIGDALKIYKTQVALGITGRQAIIKEIMIKMNVDLKKASGLHDRAKKQSA